MVHTDSGIVDIDEEIDAVAFFSEFHADAGAALFGKFNGIFQQNFQDVGYFFRVSDQNRRHFRIQIKDHLQLMPVVLCGGHGNDIVEYGSNPVRLFRGGQRTLHNLRVVQHVIDLAGQTFACHLYGLHPVADIRRKVLFQYDFTDSENHVDGSPELMRDIGQKFRVLPPCCFQFCKSLIVSFPRFLPPVNPVPGDGNRAHHHSGSKSQADDIQSDHARPDGMQNKKMIQKFQYIQGGCHEQQPLFVKHGKNKYQHTGYRRYVKQSTHMYTKKEKPDHQKSGTQVFIKRI